MADNASMSTRHISGEGTINYWDTIMPKHGKCQLCGRSRGLVNSHVYPKAAYKRFVSDQSRGGSFLNLKDMKEHPKQFTRNWFCSECEQRLDEGGERYFFNLIKRESPIADFERALYYFVTSISWRNALFYFETKEGVEHVAAALEQWRMYLLGESSTAEPYSQYLLSIQSAKWEHWNRGVGGFAMPNMHLAFSFVGPYLMLGITNPNEFTDRDKAVLAGGQLNPIGGTIQFDESMTDDAYGVPDVKLAIDFWQKVSLNKLNQFENK